MKKNSLLLFLITIFMTHLAFAKMKTVGIHELSKMIADKESILIFDANVESTRVHVGIIPGARLLESPSQYDVNEILPTDKKTKLVFYCANTMCTSSDIAAQKAMDVGYKNVFVMKEGIYGWKKAGMRIERLPAAQASLIAKEISAKDAQTMVKNNKAIIVDVRENEERHEVVPGAQGFAMSKTNNQQEWISFKKKLPKDKTIIFYCAAGLRSKKTSEKLAAEGIPSAYFKSVDQWKSEGLPTAKGPAQD